ncbi:MAG: polysaccharide deacetylase family protein, partial [Oscillospiraceae bacterium]
MYLLIRLKRKLLAVVLCICVVLSGTVYVTATAAKEDQKAIPVLMYHSILEDEKHWGKYVISPAEFEKDLAYLQREGYTAVGAAELIAYTQKKGVLPEKPIVLTFDDGYYNNYLYAYPLAKKYGTKIIISPIGYWSDQYAKESALSPYYAHCTWEQIREMSESGVVEFGNHTYNLHLSKGARLGAKQLPGESAEDYRELLQRDISTMQEKLLAATGEDTKIFTYPFGAVSENTPAIIEEMGFLITFSCESRISTICRSPES